MHKMYRLWYLMVCFPLYFSMWSNCLEGRILFTQKEAANKSSWVEDPNASIVNAQVEYLKENATVQSRKAQS